MKVAVVTPYYRESDAVLKVCLDSVRDQSHKDCRHFLVSDGFPNPLVDAYDTTHIKLPAGHGDNWQCGALHWRLRGDRRRPGAPGA